MTMIAALDRVQQIQSTLSTLFEPQSPGSALGGSAQAAGADVFAQALAATNGAYPATGAGNTIDNPGGAIGSDVVASAKKYLGVPYVFGGEDSRGMDCSGLVQRVFADLGVEVPRLVSGQMTVGTEVPSLAQAKPGDLIVLDGGDHIVIYAGNNKIIHAPYEGKDVVLRDAYFDESDITTIRRVVPAERSLVNPALGGVMPGSGMPGSQMPGSAMPGNPMNDLVAAAQAALVRGGSS